MAPSEVIDAVTLDGHALLRARVGHELAWLAGLAYSPAATCRTAMTAEGFTEFASVSRWATGTQLVMAVENRRAVIAFRGSESTLDWLVDAALVPWGSPPRHLGFQIAWWSVRGQVRGWLAAHRGMFDRLELCGHSLGGAIAKVAAFELAPDYDIDAVVTLGAPRVFWGRGVERYDASRAAGQATLGERTLSYVNGTDIVATLPPTLLGYRHTQGVCESPAPERQAWPLDLVARIRQRQSFPALIGCTNPVLTGRFGSTPVTVERDVLDYIADAYCWVESYGWMPKPVVLSITAPLALFVAYLWFLIVIGAASLSHRLGPYRHVFFEASLTRRYPQPAKPLVARIGGVAVILPLLVAGGYGAFRLLIFSGTFVTWAWHTTVAALMR